MKDHFRTIVARSEFQQKIERSDFLGIAFPAASEEEFFAERDPIAKEHFGATHHCWAFRLLHDGRARSSDAGEPSGTAGRPILAAIERADLFDVGVVVVRWFGGVKLGTGGLSRAYRDTTAETLRRADAVERFLYDRLRVIAPFDRIADVYRLVDPPAVVLVAEDFGEVNEFTFDVRRSRQEEFLRALSARRLTLR